VDGCIIERDQKYLFSFNAFNQNVPKFKTSKNRRFFLDSLAKYMLAYFKREEKFQ